MLSVFVDFFKNKEIRKRIFFTLFMLFIFRLGSAIPVPGVNTTSIELSGASSFLALASLLGGGSLENLSILSLGVGPYITASIIIELLSMDVIPALTEMAKSGKNGRKQLDRITRYLSIVLALVQGYFTMWSISNQYEIIDNAGPETFIYISIVITAGTMFTLWLADQITTKGIGNGVSIIIFAGIVANMPYNFQSVWSTFMGSDTTNALGILGFIIYCVMFIAIVVLVVVMQMSERRMPIQQSSSQALNKSKGDLNYLPLKINSASVIPVIFASSLISAPLMVTSWINTDVYNTLSSIFDFTSPWFLCVYAILIILFTFFYTNLTVDPEKMADDLGKQGTYIPGVRPGAETKDYIKKVLNRITCLGALLLAFIALLPYVISNLTDLTQSAAVGGTGIIIVVGVAMDTIKELKGQVTTKSYKGFIGK